MRRLCVAVLCLAAVCVSACVLDDAADLVGYVPAEECCPCVDEVIADVIDNLLD